MSYSKRCYKKLLLGVHTRANEEAAHLFIPVRT